MNRSFIKIILLSGMWLFGHTLCFSQGGINSEDPDPQYSVEVTAEGDTIVSYYYEPFDFGEIYTGEPDIPEQEIQPSLVTVIPSSAPTGNNAIGQIPYQEGVSPSGGRTYSIPIMTAPAVSSAPQVSIAYNSQSGNGIAGYGWNISGLSAISVAGKTHHYDNAVSPIDLNNASSNVFYLDGTRLVHNSGSLSEYQYESAQGFVLVKKNMSGSNIAYFTVKYPNGSTATYGYTNNTQNKLVYPITSLVDMNGYRIDFEYITSGNNYYISSIKYGSKTAASHPGHLSFTYTSRSDITPAYNAGLELKQDKRLTKIVSYNGNSELRTYTLTCTSKDGVSLFTKLECSVGSSALNPLNFDYGSGYESGDGRLINDGTQLLSSYFSSGSSAKPLYIRGKFVKNKYNDGLITFPGIFSPYTMIRQKKKTFLGIPTSIHYEFGSGYPANQEILVAPGLSFYSPTQSILTGAGFQTITAADVDGDGKDEIVKVNFDGISNNKTRLKVTIYTINVNGIIAVSSTNNYLVEGVVEDDDFTSPISRDYYFGDFKGNGKIQLLTVSHNKTFLDKSRTSYFALLDLGNGQRLSETSLFSYGTSDSKVTHAIDINGDGKTELCYGNSSGFDVYALRESDNVFIKQSTYSGVNGSTFTSRATFWADLNGDGKPDLVRAPANSYYYEEQNEPGPGNPDPGIGGPIDPEDQGGGYMDNGKVWTVYYATGKGFVSKSMNIVNKHSGEKYLFMDIDHDGKADMLQVNGGRVYVYPNGNGIISTVNPNSISIVSNSEIMGANTISYNRMSHFICIQNAQVYSYSYSKDREKSRLLTSLTDSYGIYRKNEYCDMTSHYGNYIGTTTARTYPYSSFIAPLNLLQSATIYNENDNNPIINLNYTYYEAVIHRTGLGFTGFEKVTVTDYIRNATTTEERDPMLFGLTTKITSPTLEASYIYASNSGNNGKANPRMTSSNEKNLLTGVSETRNYYYDSYNNPTTINRAYTGHSWQMFENRTYSNIVTSGRYLLGQPLTRKVNQVQNGVVWMDKEEIGYNSNLLPEWKKTWTGSGGDKKTGEIRWEYDSNANLLSEKSASYNSTTFQGTTYTYDAQGRYLTSKTDAFGLTITYSDYDKYGNARKVTDHKGNETNFQFDGWGQLTSAIYPNGVTESKAFAWGGTGLYTLTQNATGKPTAVIHYDAVGREILAESNYVDGVYRKIKKTYDSYGRLKTESLPYTSGTPLVKTYNYDNYDRLTSVAEPSGRTTTYSYTGNSVTTVENGISSKQTFDSRGNLIKVEDPGGTITYNLRIDGQPSSIVAPGNITTSFAYDEYGRQTGITDPSAGTQTFTYNAAGNMATQTDANGKTTTMTYDGYNRLTGRSAIDMTAVYVYNSDNQLSKESSTNGTYTTYDYDSMGRIYREINAFNNSKMLVKDYTYSYDNINSIKYTLVEQIVSVPPGGIQPLGGGGIGIGGEIGIGDTPTINTGTEEVLGTEEYVYANGYLKKILFDGTNIWELKSVNVLNQPTIVTTGPLTRIYGYNSYGFPASRATVRGSTTVGQQFSYSFDAVKGNLLSRGTLIGFTNKQESFGYDGLNRLTSYGGKTSQYNVQGNITNKSDAGAFDYAIFNKPYAISDVAYTGNYGTVENQSVTYTSIQRPAMISQGNYSASFLYNSSFDRVRMTVQNGNTSVLLRFYLGNCFEEDMVDGVKTRRLYIGGDAYTAPAVRIKENGVWNLYYIGRDYLGSIVNLYNASGNMVEQNYYDAWGNPGNPQTQAIYALDSQPALKLSRGYTGHEHLPWFGLVNMNARLYDPMLGRFLAPDPYVQMPDFSQNFNRYTYALNNPLVYTDPNGEFIFGLFIPFVGPILDAMCWGAVIGAGTSAIAYTIGAGISGNWSSNNFWNSVGMGAVGGALGGGFGALGSIGALGSFGNTLGYSMLNQAASSALTNTIYGNDLTWGSVGGMVAGSLLGSALPGFKPIDANPTLKNAIAEIGFNSGKGALTGLTSGLIQAGIDENPNAIWQNTLGGAIGGASSTMMNLAFFGPTYKPYDTYYSHDRNGQSNYRRGGLLLRDGAGLTWGRTLGVSGEGRTLVEVEAHESTHVWQQNKMGWANFYGKTITSYVSDFFKYGHIYNIYGRHGTLEWQADKAARYYMNNIY